jgi:parallel beta-helix repeat protein
MRLLAVIVCLAACGGGDPGAQYCKGVTGPCIGIAPGTSAKAIGEASVKIPEGGTIVFAPGTFMMTNTLTIAANNVTVRGAGIDQTILDFSGSTSDLGVSVANRNGFTLTDITVQNTFGDAIKVTGGTGVTFRAVHVLWQSTDEQNHGAYGLYPVQCNQVLVENSKVEGSADAGIYVGQSNQIVVRNNIAQGNVAGIEIENSHFADVYMNTATGNTAGVLIFALPDLMQVDTHDVRVYNNMIISNNHTSFAAAGSVVSMVPAGMGMLIMAATKVEAFGNTIMSNGTAQTSVVSYFLADQNFDPAMHGTYYPYPSSIWIHDNTYSGGGMAPDMTNPLGVLLAQGFQKAGISPISAILYDGMTDSAHTSTTMKNQMDICISSNGTATWANVQANLFTQNNGFVPDPDATNYTCMLSAIAPVTWNGLPQ